MAIGPQWPDPAKKIFQFPHGRAPTLPSAKPSVQPASAAQLLYAKKIAQRKGIVIPDESKANSTAMSAWIDSNRGTKRRKRSRKTANSRRAAAADAARIPA